MDRSILTIDAFCAFADTCSAMNIAEIKKLNHRFSLKVIRFSAGIRDIRKEKGEVSSKNSSFGSSAV